MDTDAMQEHLAGICRGLVAVPDDRGVADGDLVILAVLKPETRRAEEEMAAAIVAPPRKRLPGISDPPCSLCDCRAGVSKSDAVPRNQNPVILQVPGPGPAGLPAISVRVVAGARIGALVGVAAIGVPLGFDCWGPSLMVRICPEESNTKVEPLPFPLPPKSALAVVAM